MSKRNEKLDATRKAVRENVADVDSITAPMGNDHTVAFVIRSKNIESVFGTLEGWGPDRMLRLNVRQKGYEDQDFVVSGAESIKEFRRVWVALYRILRRHDGA